LDDEEMDGVEFWGLEGYLETLGIEDTDEENGEQEDSSAVEGKHDENDANEDDADKDDADKNNANRKPTCSSLGDTPPSSTAELTDERSIANLTNLLDNLVLPSIANGNARTREDIESSLTAPTALSRFFYRFADDDARSALFLPYHRVHLRPSSLPRFTNLRFCLPLLRVGLVRNRQPGTSHLLLRYPQTSLRAGREREGRPDHGAGGDVAD
jgi:hypothetical protein